MSRAGACTGGGEAWEISGLVNSGEDSFVILPYTLERSFQRILSFFSVELYEIILHADVNEHNKQQQHQYAGKRTKLNRYSRCFTCSRYCLNACPSVGSICLRINISIKRPNCRWEHPTVSASRCNNKRSSSTHLRNLQIHPPLLHPLPIHRRGQLP